jgi:hypothetical protein
MRQTTRNLQNEPGMSFGINKIEKQGGEEAVGDEGGGGPRTVARERLALAKALRNETNNSKFAKRTWNVRWNQRDRKSRWEMRGVGLPPGAASEGQAVGEGAVWRNETNNFGIAKRTWNVPWNQRDRKSRWVVKGEVGPKLLIPRHIPLSSGSQTAPKGGVHRRRLGWRIHGGVCHVCVRVVRTPGRAERHEGLVASQ